MAEKDIPESLKDLTDQFKEMHESLDKLADSQKPAEKVAKIALDHHHRPNAPAPKIELGKETRKDILSALKSIRQQIVVSQRKESTATDVAAEHLAGGGGLLGAAGEAIAFKAGKAKAALKRKFDPLNIVNRLSGGSKLTTVLAGRLMGRSEKSIRAASGLGGGIPELQDQMGSPSPYMGENSPSAMASEKATGLLEQISSSLSVIVDRMTEMNASIKNIEDSSKETTKLSEKQAEHLDQMNDDAAEERAKNRRGPQLIAKTGGAAKTEPTTKDSGWMGTFMKWFLALGVAAVFLKKLWKDLIQVFSNVGESIKGMYESIKSGLGAVKDWISDKILSAMDAVMDTVDDVVDSIKDAAGSLFGRTPLTPEEKRKQKHDRNVVDAAAGNARAQRALAKEISTPEASSEVLKKIAPSYSGKIPNEGRSATLQSLRNGELNDAAYKSLTGEEAPKGSPERVTTTGALTAMTAKAYGELYKDKEGNPLRPSQDPQKENRLPALIQSASVALAESAGASSVSATAPTLATPAATLQTTPPVPAPGAPVPLAPPLAKAGASLEQAAEAQRNAAVGLGSTNVIAPTVHQHKTINNSSQTTIHQNMAPARSGESSFLRAQDSSFARS